MNGSYVDMLLQLQLSVVYQPIWSFEPLLIEGLTN